MAVDGATLGRAKVRGERGCILGKRIQEEVRAWCIGEQRGAGWEEKAAEDEAGA